MKHLAKKTKSINKKEKARKAYVTVLFVGMILAITAVSAGAITPIAADFNGTLGNVLDWFFTITKVAGVALAGWGVAQLVMALNTHDPSQRTQGIWFLIGGIIIFFVRDILSGFGVSFTG